MNYNISYTFRLIDQFSAGAGGMAAAAARLTSSMARLGVAAGAVTAGVGSMFVGGIQAAASFEEKMASVRRVANLSREDMTRYGKEALRIATRTGQEPNEVAEIMTQGAMMGLRGLDLLKTYTELTAKAASTWDDIGPKRAGEALAQMTAQWFANDDPLMQAKKITELGDAINELSNRSAFKMPQLLSAFQRGGNAGKSYGLTAEQFSAYVGTGLVVGEKSGELQGTRSRMTFNKLLEAQYKPVQSAKGLTALGKSFQMLGLSQQEYAASWKSSPQDAMLDVMERVQKFDAVDQRKILSGILDARSADQFSKVAQNLNEYKRQLAIVDDKYASKFAKDEQWMTWLRNSPYKDMAPDLERVGRITTRVGSMEREFQQKMDMLLAAMRVASAAWNELRINMTTPLLQPLADQVRNLAGGMEWLNKTFEANPGIAKAAGIGASLVAGAGALAGLGWLTAWLTGMTASLSGLSAVLGGLGLLAAGALGVTVAVALVGAGAWIFMNWDAFVAKVTQPLDLSINWPSAPEWLQWLMGKRDTVLRDEAQRYAAQNAFGEGYQPSRAISLASDSATKAAERAAAEYSARALEHPYLRFPSPSLVDPTTFQSLRGFDRNIDADTLNWQGGRDSFNGANLAASIPQSVAVTVEPVNFNPATVNVNVTGQVNGPVQGTGSGTLQAEPSRGSSMPSVGGGSLTSPNPRNM